MLTLVERVAFVGLAIITIAAAGAGFARMAAAIARGDGQLYLDRFWRRLFASLSAYLTQRTTLRARPADQRLSPGHRLGLQFLFPGERGRCATRLLVGFRGDIASFWRVL